MSVLLVQVSPRRSSPTLVTMAGEIDIASAPMLRRRLLALPGASTVVELSGVRLLSAAGLTELVGLRDRLARAGALLALAGARPPVRRVLTATGIAGTVVVAGTVEDALRCLGAGSALGGELPRPPAGQDGCSTTRLPSIWAPSAERSAQCRTRPLYWW